MLRWKWKIDQWRTKKLNKMKDWGKLNKMNAIYKFESYDFCWGEVLELKNMHLICDMFLEFLTRSYISARDVVAFQH